MNLNHYHFFQFQYGAIKGKGMKLLDTHVGGFQFQYGAIKGLLSRLDFLPSYRLSIPVWCD